MTAKYRLVTLIICALPLCIIHAWLAWYSYGQAFGYGEAGEGTLAMLFGFTAMVLAPLLFCATPLDLIFDDNTAIMISVCASALIWWTANVWLVHFWKKPRNHKFDT